MARWTARWSKGVKSGGPVEAVGRVVADVDGQLEPGHVRGGQLQGVRQRGAAQAAAARGRGQAQVGHLPGVAVEGLGQEQDRRRVGLAPDPAEPPALGDEPAGGAVAGQDVVERADALQLGHVEAVDVRRLQGRAELGLGRMAPKLVQSSGGTPGATARGRVVLRSR